MTWRNLPVVRNHFTGDPVENNVRPINRSDIVRRIFADRGQISNDAVLDCLMREGLTCSISLIRVQRRRMFG